MSPRTPLVDPGSYFERDDRPSLRLGLGLIGANVVLSLLVTWWFVIRLIGRIDVSATARAEAESMVSVTLFGMFFAILIGYVLFAGIIHVFVWFAGGERGFGTTLVIVGESALVSILLLPLTAVGFGLLVQQVPAEPEAAIDAMERMQNGTTPVLFVVGLVRGLWEAAIQAAGIATVHEIPLGKAALVTFGLAVIGVLL
ncbi:putative conserved membrane protein, Yip1family [Halapricum desulfuricans]|uniref:Putative conserved membrane protein, Yip1family n=1 Tax=Halapricum desulfuricans TaxID=2841257 RepID=A0A897NJ57_9EURY|nr:YIP1 family protein [Halapricum desulfuricans]QSG12351.1 putative conserved membrane protein, Yip1family [Halapricum desulfuricans]